MKAFRSLVIAGVTVAVCLVSVPFSNVASAATAKSSGASKSKSTSSSAKNKSTSGAAKSKSTSSAAKSKENSKR